MRNNKSKNQNKQITEQSPVCLIKEHTGPCNHNNCLIAYKKPLWLGVSIADFYNRHNFSHFTVCHGRHAHIIPKNPNQENDFEIFRQSQNAITYIAGAWPVNIKSVRRKNVEFRWTEYMDEYPYTDPESLKTLWTQRLNVREYAFYVGPIHNSETITIDAKLI